LATSASSDAADLVSSLESTIDTIDREANPGLVLQLEEIVKDARATSASYTGVSTALTGLSAATQGLVDAFPSVATPAAAVSAGLGGEKGLLGALPALKAGGDAVVNGLGDGGLMSEESGLP